MKTKILLRAMSYMFLPTLAVLSIIFFYFFDFAKFVNFVTGEEGSIIRVIIFIIELIFVAILYFHELSKDDDLRTKNYLQGKSSDLNITADCLSAALIEAAKGTKIKGYTKISVEKEVIDDEEFYFIKAKKHTS